MVRLRPFAFERTGRTLLLALLLGVAVNVTSACADDAPPPSNAAEYAQATEKYEADRAAYDSAWYAIILFGGLAFLCLVIACVVIDKSEGCGALLMLGVLALLVPTCTWSCTRCSGPPEEPVKPEDVLETERESEREARRDQPVLDLEAMASALNAKAEKADETVKSFERELSDYREKLIERKKELGSDTEDVLLTDVKGMTWLAACRELFVQIDSLKAHSASLKESAFLTEERAKTLRRRLMAEDAGLGREELAAASVALESAELELNKSTDDFISTGSMPDEDVLGWVRTGQR